MPVDGGVTTYGRYALHREIAAGGMATVHLGRLIGPVGFARTVAIKRLHPQYAKDPEFIAMFLDEARLAARIRHPNVAPTLDVVSAEGELLLVMEYVQGESLSSLARDARERGEGIPSTIAAAIMVGALQGLHAAHEAKSDGGHALGIVHRDVSPQNIMIGADGVARVLDFGVAKAAWRAQTTKDGQIKGKLSYMAPEQLRSENVDRRVDVYAAAVVLWEILAGRRLFAADNPGLITMLVLEKRIDPPSMYSPDVPPSLDAVVLKGLARDPDERYANARQMAVALESAVRTATSREVGEWLELVAHSALETHGTSPSSRAICLRAPHDPRRCWTAAVVAVMKEEARRHDVTRRIPRPRFPSTRRPRRQRSVCLHRLPRSPDHPLRSDEGSRSLRCCSRPLGLGAGGAIAFRSPKTQIPCTHLHPHPHPRPHASSQRSRGQRSCDLPHRLRVGPTPVSLDPGKHQLRFEIRGHAPIEQTVVLREGDRSREIFASFAPPDVPRPPSSEAPITTTTRPVPWLVYGLGGLGVISGGVFGALAVTGHSDKQRLIPVAEHRPTSRSCRRHEHSTHRRSDRLQLDPRSASDRP